jgi:hypothetical protein
MSVLEKPSESERETAILKIGPFYFFPHDLTELLSSSPQHAVFRVVDTRGDVTTFMAISANRQVCPFEGGWQNVFEDFIQFAVATELPVFDSLAHAFFKTGPKQYRREQMGVNRVLKQYEDMSFRAMGAFQA